MYQQTANKESQTTLMQLRTFFSIPCDSDIACNAKALHDFVAVWLRVSSEGTVDQDDITRIRHNYEIVDIGIIWVEISFRWKG
ncbi:hypothetical protein QQG55_16960 [Brugia pahangi]